MGSLEKHENSNQFLVESTPYFVTSLRVLQIEMATFTDPPAAKPTNGPIPSAIMW